MALDDTLKGASLPLVYKRTNSNPMDSSSTFPSLDEAKEYAENASWSYRGYPGQIVSVSSCDETDKAYSTKVYKLVETNRRTNEITGLVEYQCSLDEVMGESSSNNSYLYSQKDDSNGYHTLSVGDLILNEPGEHTDTNADGTTTTHTSTGSIKNSEEGDKAFKLGQSDDKTHSELDVHTVNATDVKTGTLETTGKTVIGGNLIGSTDGGTTEGWSIKKEGGTYVLSVGKVKASENEVAEVQYVGGKIVLTQGQGIKCASVETYSDRYRCYYDANESDCKFIAGDFALCERYENSSVRKYWRKVLVKTDSYIELSISDCLQAYAGVAPEVGDTIVHLGNEDGESSRASAIILDASTTPVQICQYLGIDTMTEPLPTPKIKLSSEENIFTGTINATASDGTETNVNTEIKNIKDSIKKGDGEFIIWKADYTAPKDSNGDAVTSFASDSYAPSKDWTSTEIVSHEGDFLVTTDGFVYNLVLSNEVYSWNIVTDKYLNDAIKEATEAKSLASQAQEKLNKLASDNWITDIEYNGDLATVWADTKAEYSQIYSQVTETQVLADYTNAYNGVSYWMDYLDDYFSLSSNTSLYIEGRKVDGKTFGEAWADYYTNRTIAQNSIKTSLDSATEKAQKTADAASKIFTGDSLPTPPYKVGDMWIRDSAYTVDSIEYANPEFYCIVERKSGETTLQSDWKLVINQAHLVVTKNSITASVEKDLSENVIAITTDGVSVMSKTGGQMVSLLKVGTDGTVTINSDLITIDGSKISLKGKTITISADETLGIDSTNFKVDNTGKVTATNGSFEGSIKAKSFNIEKGFTPLAMDDDTVCCITTWENAKTKGTNSELSDLDDATPVFLIKQTINGVDSFFVLDLLHLGKGSHISKKFFSYGNSLYFLKTLYYQGDSETDGNTVYYSDTELENKFTGAYYKISTDISLASKYWARLFEQYSENLISGILYADKNYISHNVHQCKSGTFSNGVFNPDDTDTQYAGATDSDSVCVKLVSVDMMNFCLLDASVISDMQKYSDAKESVASAVSLVIDDLAEGEETDITYYTKLNGELTEFISTTIKKGPANVYAQSKEYIY